MGLISRVYRFINGTANDGSEVDSEFQTVFDAINGNLDNANIAAGAAIAASKVDPIPPDRVLDHADDESTFKTAVTAGDTGTPSLPTTLEGDLERLRYRIGASRRYIGNTYYMDNAGPTSTTAGWYEPPIVGPNLIPNPGFEAPLVSSTPPGWSLVLTPTLAIENPANATTGVEKRSLNITTNASFEGISCAIGGLKQNTKYLIGMRYTRTAGEINLETTGGLAAGDYQNLIFADSTGTSLETYQGIVKSENSATPSDITITISCTATGAEFNIHDVWMYELADGAPNELPSIPMQTATYSTANDTLTNSGAGAWSNRAALTLSQYIPYLGYRLVYETTLCFRGEVLGGATDENYEFAFRVQRTIDANPATTVEGPYAWRHHLTQSGEGRGGIVTLKYVVENPTPGSTYSFSVDAYTQGTGDAVADLIFNPTVATGLATQSQARLIVERI